MQRFDDKVIVITGGSSGIGLAAAKKFVKEGASVVIAGRDSKALTSAIGALGGKARSVQVDVTQVSDLDRLFATVRQHYGRVDVLFANAGAAQLVPIEDTTEEVFDLLINTNTRATFFTAQKATPLMANGATIILNTSFFAELGMAGTAVLAASKAAVRSLTRTFAAEFVDRGIRVNSVSPGAIETPIYSKLGMPQEAVEQVAQSLTGQIPMKRFGRADEVANVVAFLASDDASYMTGCDIPIDGGLTQI